MKALKAIRNFVLLNLFLLTPLLVTVALNAVREMSLEFVSDSSALNILVGDGGVDSVREKYDLFFRGVADKGSDQSVRQYCSTEMSVNTPRFLFETQGQLSIRLGTVRLHKYFVLDYTIPVQKLLTEFTVSESAQVSDAGDGFIRIVSGAGKCVLSPKAGVDMWQFERVRIPKLIMLGLVALELIFVIVAWLVSVFPSKSISKRDLLVCSLYSALLFATVVSFVIPLQTFLSNKVSYEIATGAFVLDLLKYFVVGLMVSYVCLVGLGIAFGTVPYVLLFGFVFYEYLQTGILSIGEPVISGNLSYYANKVIMARDSVVIICILLFCGWLIRGGRTWFKWAVLIIGVMTLCSLCDVRANRSMVAIDGDRVGDLCSRLDAAQSVTFSKARNVMVFVLDSCTTEVVNEIFEGDEALRRSFNGFCSFDNNIGIHQITTPSSAGLMTGMMNRSGENSVEYAGYVNSVFSEDSLLYFYRNAGCPTYYVSPGYAMGMAYPRVEGSDKCTYKSTIDPLFSRFGDSQKFTVYELVRFRMSPFILKPYVYKYTSAGMGGYAKLQSEFGLYSLLKRAPIVDDVKNTFQFMHTEGGHFPYDINRFGQKCVSTDEGYGPYFEKSYNALNNLSNLLENFRRRGIYDCSDIFVLADHGADETKTMPDVENGLPLRAHPMLMVKPANSTGEFMIDHTTSTSMLNLHSVLEREMDRSLTLDEIKQLLTSAERKFVWIGENSFSEWIVNANREAKLISDRDVSVRRKR